MSLPPLLRYVYNHGNEEVTRRGKRIYNTGGATLLDYDPFVEQARFRVRNDQYQNIYTVVIQKYATPDSLSLRCPCPYNAGEVCRHKVAALFQLNDLLQTGFLRDKDLVYDQKHTVIRMRTVSEAMLSVFAGAEVTAEAKELAKKKKAKLVKESGDTLEAEVPGKGGKKYHVTIRQNEERYFDTSCDCDETTRPLCLHKTTVFLQTLLTHSADHFFGMRNWDEQKRRLLSIYGYTLEDDLKGKFEFKYDSHGKPSLRVLDPSIKRVIAPTPSLRTQPVTAGVGVPASAATPKTPGHEKPEAEGTIRIAVVVHHTPGLFPYIDWDAYNVYEAAGEETLEKWGTALNLATHVAAIDYPVADGELLPVLRKVQSAEALRYLQRIMPFDAAGEAPEDDPTDERKLALWEYLLPKYARLMQLIVQHPHSFWAGETDNPKKFKPITASTDPARLRISFTSTAKGVKQRIQWSLDGIPVTLPKGALLGGLILYHDTLYALGSPAEVALAQQLYAEGAKNVISKTAWPAYLQEVMQWPEAVRTTFDDTLSEVGAMKAPQLKVYLEERENTLVLRPMVSYDGVEVMGGTEDTVRIYRDGKVILQPRDLTAENLFLQKMQALHSDIYRSADSPIFFLPAAAVLSQNWFFRFSESMEEDEVELLGLSNLRGLKLSPHKPQTLLRIGSGTDWFDAKLELSYGGQPVPLADLKKAMAQKQNFVRLSDGSMGMLPDEWLEKYGLLLKMGEVKNGALRLKKHHFGVVEPLFEEIESEDLQEEIAARKARLTAIVGSDYSSLEAPEDLVAQLRPYQLTGFQWLRFLYEAGWGGILADDMGLGKTVQTLAFFLHLKKEMPGARFLVVCPTTLVYNWEAEVLKFAPELSYHIHHGSKRQAAAGKLADTDLIITTYGTLRSDIKIFKAMHFTVAVLDESQAIKNPQSQVARASLQLDATHRVALSGTPLQNNTFDLYSQLNFLNPGMLGSREFFMSEFATPIDKFGEGTTKRQLRQLTHPFILRRTKEQVASDLPQKTETVLFCEMGPAQRKVYNSYRTLYRDKILGMIDTQGLEKSQFHILQGITRMRQLCDATSLVAAEAENETHSVKLEEITREIEENIGEHKALIFSQFLGMLALIRERLEAQGIPHVYFDGSSTAEQRKTAVEQFQENDDCRVFLISLKAGGVGLNLTAADYVYLVDPWWNPAVEQQAIDRTHRIGQTKAVFAYRLICRDSIEEKMLQLQERKRSLALELINDDGAVLKKLTREDIDYLLS